MIMPGFIDMLVSYGGDSLENGGIQKKFKIVEPSGPYSYFGNDGKPYDNELENSDMFNSKLENQTFIERGNNNQLYKIQSVDYTYKEIPNKPVTNISKSARLFDICCEQDNSTTTGGLYLGLYGQL